MSYRFAYLLGLNPMGQAEEASNRAAIPPARIWRRLHQEKNKSLTCCRRIAPPSPSSLRAQILLCTTLSFERTKAESRAYKISPPPKVTGLHFVSHAYAPFFTHWLIAHSSAHRVAKPLSHMDLRTKSTDCAVEYTYPLYFRNACKIRIDCDPIPPPIMVA
jgi:hypothetical protein